MSNEIDRVDEVFSVEASRLPQNYVRRSRVDDVFSDLIRRGNPVWLCGSSKQGKTALRTGVLDANVLVVRCSQRMNAPKLYEQIFKRAGCKTKTIDDQIQVIYTTTTSPVQRVERTCDPCAPQDICDVLRDVCGDKYLVIEEFHRLSQEAARSFMQDLKSFAEEGFGRVVIVATGRDEGLLNALNSDLALRLKVVNVNHWSNDDLARVVSSGFEKLQLSLNPQDVERIVTAAVGSVYLAQLVSADVARAIGRSQPFDVDQITMRHLRTLDVVYVETLKTIAGGHNRGSSFPYHVIVRTVIRSDLAELDYGLSREYMRTAARLEDCEQQVVNALERVERLQERRDTPVILAHEAGTLRFRSVERMFSAWLRMQDREELLRRCRLSDDHLDLMRQSWRKAMSATKLSADRKEAESAVSSLERATQVGHAKGNLVSAILNAFPTEAELEMLLSHEMDLRFRQKFAGGSYGDRVSEFVEWLFAQHRLRDFVAHARAINPGNGSLRRFEDEYERLEGARTSDS